MATIHVLDKHIAELIAAGEVVERPASVVKELMENAIDAGADHVTVEIRNGGVTYIRITDNGCGIRREDVPIAFLRHATSKVRTQKDLDSISTLGFRGEALASVAAVAKVEVTTCEKGELVGTHYVIHGGEEIALEDAGCAEGSTFVVEDLFYNIPARMKFLKKDVSEGNAVAGVVERLALSHPEIAVKFIRDGRTELQTSGDGRLLECIYAVFGKAFAATLLPVEFAVGGICVSGYICKPEDARPNRTMQHFFVNRRYVKTQTAMVALERAYKGTMMVGRFPACVLSVELPAETVDANVHPAKIEVRFINEKPVFDAVYYAVRSALEARADFRQVTLTQEVSEPPKAPPTASIKKEVTPPKPVVLRNEPKIETPAGRSYLDITVDTDAPREFSLHHAFTEKQPASSPVPKQAEKQPVHPAAEAAVTVQTAPPQEIPEQPPIEETTPTVRLVGELFKTYILAEMGESLFLIDKHAAHERILYNQLKEQAQIDTQPLLTPASVTVSREEHSALLESLDELRQAGIQLEDFGGQSVLVRCVPLLLAGADIEATVREIASGLCGGNHEVRTAKLDWIYHSSACRAAIKAGDSSQPAELLDLAERVLLHTDIRHCPHGRPVCVEMTRKELEKQFGRIV